MRDHPPGQTVSTEPAIRAFAARILPLLDLTSLGEDDTPARIESLCAAAASHGAVAAVCVQPEHVTTARRALSATPVAVATVVNFPDGADDPGRIERETRRAVAAGAQEIDAVLPYRTLLAGLDERARRTVDACREACRGLPLKLIIESGVLEDADAIERACRIGLDAGVDFLKTSTGRAAVHATPDAARTMLDAIAAGGARCGFKAAGGIRTLDDARVYVELAEARLGAGFVAPRTFRIGASALHGAILAALGPAP